VGSWRAWLARLALAAFATVAPALPAAALSKPPPPGRVLDLQPRIIDLAPRVIDVRPVVQTQPGRVEITVTSDVLFAFNSATLSPDAQAVLADVVSRLRTARPGIVVVAGYTDSIGTDAYNLDLSTRRAGAVRDALVSQGLAGPTFQVVGKGKADPVAPNTNANGSDNPEGRRLNRRVVVTLPG